MDNLKLGKLPPVIDKRTIKLKTILKELPPLPSVWDNQEVYNIVDNFMYANDQYGDCVKAARAHQTLVFEGFEQGKQIEITDQEVIDEYFEETGGADNGLVLLFSLRDWRNDGWPVGGKNYTIYAFAQCDTEDLDELRHSIHLLGGVNAGMDVYEEDMRQFRAGETWHITENSGSKLGGHGIYIFAYDLDGFWCMTWGKAQKMTFEFLLARCDEAYAIVDNINHWQADSPLDVVALKKQLDKITEGRGEPKGCFALSWLLSKSPKLFNKVFLIK